MASSDEAHLAVPDSVDAGAAFANVVEGEEEFTKVVSLSEDGECGRDICADSRGEECPEGSRC